MLLLKAKKNKSNSTVTFCKPVLLIKWTEFEELSGTVVFNFFVCIPPDVISQLCTPKVVGV
jgi:hypothetical protein